MSRLSEIPDLADAVTRWNEGIIFALIRLQYSGEDLCVEVPSIARYGLQSGYNGTRFSRARERKNHAHFVRNLHGFLDIGWETTNGGSSNTDMH